MKVSISPDCERVIVHRMDPVHQRGPVFYASLARENENCRDLLVSALWDHLLAVGSPLRPYCQSSRGAALPIQLAYGLLGRPHLLVGESPGPAISFSEGSGRVWAALSGDESDIGIDVAGTDEFHKEYPFQRVFQPHELQHALMLTGGDPAEASALLWSVKEAVVKALGCAFHLVEPRHINVYPSAGGMAGEGEGYGFSVGLTGKARERFPLADSRSLWVHSRPLGTMWLSIALLDRSATGHE
ncbi:MAG: 4'-phosphopantetheinyl transferase superfamily protein [Geobacteraceae bacterium]